jgi:hypothetical protein
MFGSGYGYVTMEEMLHSSKGEILTKNLRYTNLLSSSFVLISSMPDPAEPEFT